MEFCITIFVNSSEFLSNIKPGDILRLQRIGTQPWINNREQMEFLVRSDRDHQVVVFPSDDRDGPFCPDPRFNVTKEDVKMVQQLKVWYEEIKNSRNSTPLRVKLNYFSNFQPIIIILLSSSCYSSHNIKQPEFLQLYAPYRFVIVMRLVLNPPRSLRLIDLIRRPT